MPRGGSALAFDLGNNNATEHWDDVCANTFTVFSDSRVKNSIETLHIQQLIHGIDLADYGVRPDFYAQLFDVFDFGFDDCLGQTKLGDTVH